MTKKQPTDFAQARSGMRSYRADALVLAEVAAALIVGVCVSALFGGRIPLPAAWTQKPAVSAPIVLAGIAAAMNTAVVFGYLRYRLRQTTKLLMRESEASAQTVPPMEKHLGEPPAAKMPTFVKIKTLRHVSFAEYSQQTESGQNRS